MPLAEDKLKYQPGEPLSPEQVPPGTIVSPDTQRANRIPPGQSRTRKWPVLHYGAVPHISRSEWRLEVLGLVDRPFQLDWEAFQALPRVRVLADFHCVTRWSRLGNLWEGVSTRELVSRAGARPHARFVILHAYDGGWTTNLPLADFLSPDALLADSHDGLPLSADHGGPVRAVVPLLYAWKSAKWIKAIELVAHDQPGYWERGGYHNHGDPWNEERYGW
jgi:DMSO/TMAO reductase YedYZ molybdopterin-dependent catalytic subunit